MCPDTTVNSHYGSAGAQNYTKAPTDPVPLSGMRSGSAPMAHSHVSVAVVGASGNDDQRGRQSAPTIGEDRRSVRSVSPAPYSQHQQTPQTQAPSQQSHSQQLQPNKMMSPRPQSQMVQPQAPQQPQVPTQQQRPQGLIKFNNHELKRDNPALARGSYGVVYTGHAPGFSQKVVIKDMTILNNKSVDDWRKEVQTMAYAFDTF